MAEPMQASLRPGAPAQGSGLKASMARIGTWVKAHPIPSVIIAIVLVVIGWLIYKKFGSLSPAQASSSADQTTAADSGASPIGDGGISGSLGGPGGGLQTVNPLDPSTFQTGGGGGSGGGGYVAPVTASPIDYGSFLLPAEAGAAPSPIAPQTVISNTGVGAAGASNLNKLRSELGGYTPTYQIQNNPVGTTGSQQPGGRSGGIGSAPAPAIAPAPVQAPARSQPQNQTPAQALGKGRNFTGYINGVYYNKGYPSTTHAVTPPTLTLAELAQNSALSEVK